MAEYPVMSTLQGTYGRIEQTLYVIRDTYEICRAGGRGARTGIGKRWTLFRGSVVHLIFFPSMELGCSEKMPKTKKLVFGDEFLAQGLHLQSHQRC